MDNLFHGVCGPKIIILTPEHLFTFPHSKYSIKLVMSGINCKKLIVVLNRCLSLDKDIKIQNKITIEIIKEKIFKNLVQFFEKSPTRQEEGKTEPKTFAVFRKMILSPFFLFVEFIYRMIDYLEYLSTFIYFLFKQEENILFYFILHLARWKQLNKNLVRHTSKKAQFTFTNTLNLFSC